MIFGGFGAYGGASGAKSLATSLTGGDTPDKLGPPQTLPANTPLEPTITTAQGDRYALVQVEGKYTWFAMLDNSSLNLASPYIEVVSGAKMAELTGTYLAATDFPAQLADYAAQVAEAQRQQLQDAFIKGEIDHANSVGPDGKTWGTTSTFAPNATQTWTPSPQAGQALNTIDIRNPDGSTSRIVQEIDRSSGKVLAEKVYESSAPGEAGHLVATADYQSGVTWGLNRETGVMEQGRLAGFESAAGGAQTAYFNPNTALSSQSSDHSITVRPGDTVTSIARQYGMTVNEYSAYLKSVYGENADLNSIVAGRKLPLPEDVYEREIGSKKATQTTDAHDPTDPHSADAVNGSDLQSDQHTKLNLQDIKVPDLVSTLAPWGSGTGNPNLGGAYGYGQLNGFDILPFNDKSSFLLNSEGDIVGEMNLQPGGALQLKNLSGQSVYVIDDKVLTPGEYEQAQTQAQQAQAALQATQAASAVGLMNSIIGLQHWDAMNDLQRTAALVSIYNTVDVLTGKEALPGNLGAAAGVLGLLNALDQGNVGAAMVSGIAIVDSLASDAASNAIGSALNIPAGKVIPVLNLILAIDSGDPVSIIAAACAFIPVYGQLIAAAITICNALFGDDDLPMSEGAAHAQWDAAGNLQIVTDQNDHGGGPTAEGWMSALANGLQDELAKNTDEHGIPLYGLIPNLLPTIGFKFDPDGFNYSSAQGHMFLSWVDDNGITQTRYYDGAGNRNDGTGETLAGDFMQHAMAAIAPAWAVQTTLAHWQAGRGMHLPLEKASLPQESEDGLTQTLQVLTLGLPGFEPTRQSLIDVDADGYLEATQWVQANQAMLAIDVNGDGHIGAGELLHLQDTSTFNSLHWLDANNDGQLNASDPAFAALRLWMDVNGDGISRNQAGSEVQTLTQAGITAIDFAANPPRVTYADGSTTALTAQMLTADTLGVSYRMTVGGVLQTSEQADGSGVAVLAAVNTREFDGMEGHVHGGEKTTVEVGDERLQSTGTATVESASEQTTTTVSEGDARLGSAPTRAPATVAQSAVARAADVRSQPVVFVPTNSGGSAIAEVVAGMVRTAEAAAGSPATWATVALAAGATAGAAPVAHERQQPLGASPVWSDEAAPVAALPIPANDTASFGTYTVRQAPATAASSGSPQGVPFVREREVARTELTPLPVATALETPQMAHPLAATPRDPSPEAPAVQSYQSLPSPEVRPLPAVASEILLTVPTVPGERVASEEDANLRIAPEVLLASAASSDGSALRLVSVQGAVRGQVSIDAQGHVVFVPEANHHGAAGFFYTVSDPYGLQSTAWATLDIATVNDAPVVSGEAATGDEDTALVFAAADLLANDSDVDTLTDGDVLRIARVGHAVHGTVDIRPDGSVRFVPDAHHHGAASFAYWVADATGTESMATVRLTVLAVNDVPVAQGETIDSLEDGVLRIPPGDLLANDSDVDSITDGQTLSIVAVSAARHGTVSLGADGHIVFVPEANYHGIASFDYTVSDGAGGTATTTAVLQLASVNDVPQPVADATRADEDQSLLFTAASLLANDGDPDIATDGDLLRLVRVGEAQHGTVSLDADGNVRFVPEANHHGLATFTYWAADTAGAETPAQVTIRLDPVNDLPVVQGEVIDGREDTTLIIDPTLLLANDTDVDTATDGQVLSITAVDGAVSGTVTLLPDGRITFVPQADFSGRASFSYRVSDGAGGEVWAMAQVEVEAVNDAPDLRDEIVSATEDVALQIDPALLLANDSDRDNAWSDLRIVSVGNATHGTVSMDGAGTLRFVPQADYHGLASFTYTVADGSGGFSVGTATLEIAPVNDAPRLVGETLTLDEDTQARFTAAALLTNDSDVDNAHSELAITTVGGAVGGTVALMAGEIVFTPTLNRFGPASFTYTVSDGAGGASQATVSLSFTPVNDAPVANGEAFYGRRNNAYTFTQAALLANDTDVEDPGGLAIVSVSNAVHGTVALLPDGSVRFTPLTGFAGTATFDYVVQDPQGARSTATTTIDFSRLNTPPQATDDSFIGFEDVAFSIAAAQLLVNDSDVDEDRSLLRVTAVADASHGTAAIDAGGNVTFTPAADYFGPASFRYQVTDSEGASTWATAYLTVQGVNDAPIIEDIWYGRPIYGHQLSSTYHWESGWTHTYSPITDAAAAQAVVAGGGVLYRATPTQVRNDLEWITVNEYSATSPTYYRNGQMRPIEFDTTDATVIAYWDGAREAPIFAPWDDPYRQNGGVVAYDPDGNSSAIFFSLGSTPQHGHAWVNMFTPDSVKGTLTTHAEADPYWVGASGAWQYYSHLGDTYGGNDPFTIRVTDGQGASTMVTIEATHAGSSPSGGGGCPIVIDLNNDGIDLIRPEDSNVFMDINGDGWKDRIGWAAASDAILVLDANGDGRVDIDHEVSFVDHLPGARTDLEGLAAHDSNGDGWITAADDRWKEFGLFQDRNANGVQDEGEFVSLDEAGLSGISLTREGSPQMNQGNVVFGTSQVQWADGGTTRAGDVMFAGDGVPLPSAAQIALLFTQYAALPPQNAPHDSPIFVPPASLEFTEALVTATAAGAVPGLTMVTS